MRSVSLLYLLTLLTVCTVPCVLTVRSVFTCLLYLPYVMYLLYVLYLLKSLYSKVTLKECIGSGTSGDVYRADYASTEVACKLLRKRQVPKYITHTSQVHHKYMTST